MRVNVTRAQNVRQYHHWTDIEIPDDLVQQYEDGDLSDEQFDAAIDQYLDYDKATDNIDSADERDLWFDIEEAK